MWMAYVEEIEIKDLQSGVENLQQKFSNLKFDAEHEAIYGMSTYFTEECCTKLANEYLEAVEVCEDYLAKSIDIDELIDRLIHLEMVGFLKNIKQFLPPHLMEKISQYEEGEESAEEDTGETSSMEN